MSSEGGGSPIFRRRKTKEAEQGGPPILERERRPEEAESPVFKRKIKEPEEGGSPVFKRKRRRTLIVDHNEKSVDVKVSKPRVETLFENEIKLDESSRRLQSTSAKDLCGEHKSPLKENLTLCNSEEKFQPIKLQEMPARSSSALTISPYISQTTILCRQEQNASVTSCGDPVLTSQSLPGPSRTLKHYVNKALKVEAGEGTSVNSSPNSSMPRSTLASQHNPSRFRATNLLLRELPPFLSIGCPWLDRALAGGVRRSSVTEVAGESGSGKTQFCLQCTLQASRRGQRSVYICTEGAFPQARLDQLVGDQVELLSKVLVKQVRDLHHLLAVLGSQLEEVVSNVVLVVVDSVAAVVRNDSDFNSGKLERSGAVHKIGQGLLRIAMKYKVAVLAVNQATDIMEEETSSDGRTSVASLGKTWSSYLNTRLWISKTSKVIGRTPSVLLQGLQVDTRLRKMEVDSSSHLPTSTTYFIVETAGLRGVRIAGAPNL